MTENEAHLSHFFSLPQQCGRVGQGEQLWPLWSSAEPGWALSVRSRTTPASRGPSITAAGSLRSPRKTLHLLTGSVCRFTWERLGEEKKSLCPCIFEKGGLDFHWCNIVDNHLLLNLTQRYFNRFIAELLFSAFAVNHKNYATDKEPPHLLLRNLGLSISLMCSN